MVKITPYGKVTRFDLSRNLAGRGRYWTTAYLVDGVLVDTGCAHCALELVGLMESSSLFQIVNTHTHEDHIGANGLLQRRYAGLNISAHPLALPVLADPRGKQPLQTYRRLFWGWPEPSQGQPIADDAEIETGHHRFRVIYTPGHSPDHLCLYEPSEGWLFTGDLFVGGKDRALRAGYDIWQIIASLKRIAALHATRLFPGSARVRDDPARELTSKIAYLEGLGEKVLTMRQRGLEASEIVGPACGGPMWIELITLGHFSRRRLVLSYLGMNKES